MAYSDKQKIAIHFYETTGLKSTKQVFINTMSQAQSLLNAGYSLDDIIRTIDYLKTNPPKKGFFSLGLVQYVIEETLIKVKAQETKKEMEKEEIKSFLNTEEVKQDNSNSEKYKSKTMNITNMFKR